MIKDRLLRMGLIACAVSITSCAGITKTTDLSDFYQLRSYSADLFWQRHGKLYAKTEGGDFEFLGNTKDPGWAEQTPFGFSGLRASNLALSADGRVVIYEHYPHGSNEKAPGLYRHEYGVGDSLVLEYGTFSIPATSYPKPLPANIIAFTRYGRDAETSYADQALLADGTIIPLLLIGAGDVHRAAFEGDTQALSRLPRDDGSSLESLTYWDMSPLEIAVLEGRTEAAKQLLDLGASYKTDGPSLLLVATQYQRYEIVDELLRRGSPYDYFLETGKTPFHATLVSNSISSVYPGRSRDNDETVKTIDAYLRHGVDINLRDEKGHTLLHNTGYVFLHNSFDHQLVEYLMSKGIDVDAVDHDGNTALHYLSLNMMNERHEESWRKTMLPLLELLVPRMRNIDHKNERGLSPLQSAVKKIPPAVRTAEYLIAHGADASVPYVPHPTRVKQPGVTIQDKLDSIKKSEWWQYRQR